MLSYAIKYIKTKESMIFQIREIKVSRKHFSVKTVVSTYLGYFFFTVLLFKPIQSSHMTLRNS